MREDVDIASDRGYRHLPLNADSPIYIIICLILNSFLESDRDLTMKGVLRILSLFFRILINAISRARSAIFGCLNTYYRMCGRRFFRMMMPFLREAVAFDKL